MKNIRYSDDPILLEQEQNVALINSILSNSHKEKIRISEIKKSIQEDTETTPQKLSKFLRGGYRSVVSTNRTDKTPYGRKILSIIRKKYPNLVRLHENHTTQEAPAPITVHKLHKTLHEAIYGFMEHFNIDNTILNERFHGTYLGIHPVLSDTASNEYVTIVGMCLEQSRFEPITVFRTCTVLSVNPKPDLSEFQSFMGFSIHNEVERRLGGLRQLHLVGLDRRSLQFLALRPDLTLEPETPILEGICTTVNSRGHTVSTEIAFIRYSENAELFEQPEFLSRLSQRMPVRNIKNTPLLREVVTRIRNIDNPGSGLLWEPR
ncbi:hypothetical protein [Pacificispira sp.]|uniref:hypothetical protein n=1 Tax=Pacificispira sp. TaxID=2888761 RepID=UPI003B5269DE